MKKFLKNVQSQAIKLFEQEITKCFGLEFEACNIFLMISNYLDKNNMFSRKIKVQNTINPKSLSFLSRKEEI